MVTLRVRLGESSFHLLERLASQLGYKREAIIELALQEYLSKYELKVEDGQVKVVSAKIAETKPLREYGI